jgi:acyl-[acyl-carrier-protein]-phospholipid O-acyltransferase/long-chain-fatty-acid--[acyl-carrier-protein] ligase
MSSLSITVAGLSYFSFVITVLLAGLRIPAAPFAAGLLAGLLAARRLAGDRAELGLPPLGALGFSAASFSLPFAGASLALGCSSGLVLWPLAKLLLQRGSRGIRIAGLAAPAAAIAAGVLVTGRIPGQRLPLVFGLLTFAGTIYVLWLLPEFLIRFTLWIVTHTIYRIRIVGRENQPRSGPALLVANHISLVDGLLVGACVQRFVRFLIYRNYYYLPVLHGLFRRMKAIPIAGGDPERVAESIERARQQLRDGHVVCIFAEGAVSRTGNLLKFKRGLERISAGLDIPIIPVHLDRLWGSIFSFQAGRFFWKWPQRIPYPVTVSFGKPLPANSPAHVVRKAVLELGAEAASVRCSPRDTLARRLVRTARRNWFRFCMADSTGRELSYGRFLIAAMFLSRRVRRLPASEQPALTGAIGVLLPASVAGALANAAITLAGRVPVNLNFTAGAQAMESALRQRAIETVLSSRAFLHKAELEEPRGAVFLEDLLAGFSGLRKVRAVADALVAYRPPQASPDSPAAVLFSSGSTGEPKGVVLSHYNIVSNVESVGQVFWLQRGDRVLGVLPFFHAFGLVDTLWLPLLVGLSAVYHPNPLDAAVIGGLARRYRATILTATPAFHQAYVRKCAADDFASIRFALVGAERLRQELADAFREKFGRELLEGYGATEMSAVISVNVPNVEMGREQHTGWKPGTVGHPIPGVAVQVVDPETRAPLGPNQDGLLLVKGPGRMLGYLGQPEQTAEVLHDGWYVTGDIAAVDDDGFIRLTDRLARFSKIGGEMVPHLKIEEAVNRLLGSGSAVVTSAPDDRKGERLVVFHTRTDLDSGELWSRLQGTGLPKLWLPKRDAIVAIDSIPTLGSGKVDFRRLREIARDRLA